MTARLPRRPRGRQASAAGFTLIEILVVVLVIGILATTLTVTLVSTQGRDLVHEAERLAAALREAGMRARAEGVSYEWRPVDDGYVVKPRDAADSRPPTYTLAPGVRIVATRSGGNSVEAIVMPARTLAGAASITLQSETEEVDVVSDGLNRYTVSDTRQRTAPR